MKKYFKSFSIILSVILFSFLFLGSVFFLTSKANAFSLESMTLEELQSLLTRIRSQIEGIQRGEGEWCHDFNVNLRYGMNGSEVRALQEALKKEGFYNRSVTGYFNQYTASAVVGFQEKYASEVLVLWGLNHGTGYVGSTTIAKLNNLFGCEEESETCHTSDLWSWEYCTPDCKCNAGEGDCDKDSDCNTGHCAYNVGEDYGQSSKMDVCEEENYSINVNSPKEDEEWKIGEEHEISWRSNYDGKVNIILLDARAGLSYYVIARNIDEDDWEYNWEFPQEAEEWSLPGNHVFKVWIGSYDPPSKSGDWEPLKDEANSKIHGESEYFTISSSGEKSITVISPNGGEEWEKGETYVIDWESIGVDDIEVISLIDYSNSSNPMGYHLTYHHSTEILYSWTISDSFEVGDKYKIEITASEGDEIVSDESNSYFSIVESLECNDADISSGETSGVSDGVVNIYDLLKVRQCVGEDASGDCEVADINNDGVINEDDADIVRSFYLQECIE